MGWIYVTRDQIDKEYEGFEWRKRKTIEEILKSEVEVYDQYLQGDVYQYVIEKDVPGELSIVEALSGCYGFDYCLEQAREVVDRLTAKEKESWASA